MHSSTFFVCVLFLSAGRLMRFKCLSSTDEGSRRVLSWKAVKGKMDSIHGHCSAVCEHVAVWNRARSLAKNILNFHELVISTGRKAEAFEAFQEGHDSKITDTIFRIQSDRHFCKKSCKKTKCVTLENCIASWLTGPKAERVSPTCSVKQVRAERFPLLVLLP